MTPRHFLTIMDLQTSELEDVLDLARTVKGDLREGKPLTPMKGKVLGLIFHKPSLRTRVSFESGMQHLGGSAIYLSNQEIGMGTREAVSDIAEVLSRYVDAIMIRTFSQKWVEDLAAHASIPVINGLTDEFHPCQILADLQTMAEAFLSIENRHVLFMGDGNNVARSWINAARRLPIKVTICCPEGFEPDAAFTKTAADETGGRVRVVHNPGEVIQDIDVIYTDVWASMGQEDEAEARKKSFAPYQVNMALVDQAKDDAIVLHCLPAHRGEEITHDVMTDPRSRIFDQAENRMHAQNALMIRLMGDTWK